MRHRRLLAAAGALALMLPMAVASAEEGGAGLDDLLIPGTTAEATVPASLLNETGAVTVLVELTDDPITVVEANTDGQLSSDQEKALEAKLLDAQETVASALAELGGEVEDQLQWTLNGIQVTIDASQLDAVRAVPGVKAVYPVPVHERSNATADPYTGVHQVWDGAAGTGYTGERVKVAVIDTGIDYTHATFGGAGTAEAFAAATAASDPTPFYAGTNVVGGIDLVGDAYGVDNNPPVPDNNPIDCEMAGHGTHVAGTVGGKGVLSDGSTFHGPYNAQTFEDNSFQVGPGTAPGVSLYAIKVFGCKGATGVTVRAIEAAVSDFDVDVINLSLGSDFGRADDPSSKAAANAAAAGKIVVVAAGNAGSSPYLVGAPSVAPGVLSVAANDAAETFPGVRVDWGAASVTGINANSAALPAGAAPIHVLDDGDGGISSGCEPADYEGMPAGSIVVTKRGVCARVAKAIFGQAAGASAVIMVNNDESLPPMEGDIIDNPDTGDVVETELVTIPFIGVRASDGGALQAAQGTAATLGEDEVANPSYREYASFTSAGPRVGDSYLRPTVTAPGVSVISAMVGGGTAGTVKSGTSMATPHAAGIAALAKEAHPDWTGQEITASLVSTAKPNRVGDYVPTRGGGQIDPWAATHTNVFAYTDTVDVMGQSVYESALSFGFHEVSDRYEATKRITLVNKGNAAVTYQAKVVASSVSQAAEIEVSPTSVTVPAGGTANVDVTMTVEAAAIPQSLGSGGSSPWFYEVSGNIEFTSEDDANEVQNVPYLMVPRAMSDVTATATALGPNTGELVFSNAAGAASAEFGVLFHLGLTDGDDLEGADDTGQDLASVGVTNFESPGTPHILGFAINTHSRFSNAAINGFEISIDNNLDGKDDKVLLVYDQGVLTSGQANGIPASFVLDVATEEAEGTGYKALAPTDSSTLIALVDASDVGVTGKFSYSISSRSLIAEETAGMDSVDGRAYYDPTKRVFVDDSPYSIPAGASKTVPLTVDVAAMQDQGTAGWMAVFFDNTAGTAEALTGDIPVKPDVAPTPDPTAPPTITPTPPVKPTPPPVKPGLPDTGTKV